MNKYKLVPFLVLSKEEALINTMQEELTTLLNNKSIDVSLKRALYEDLLNKISRFKESIPCDKSVRFTVPTNVTSVDTQTENDTNTNQDAATTTETTATDVSAAADTQGLDATLADSMSSTAVRAQSTSTRHRSRSTAPSAASQNPDDDSGEPFELASPRGRAGRRVRQARVAELQQQQQEQQLSPSTTRGGVSYHDPTLPGNRSLGTKRTWNRDNHPGPWKR
ncbi:hypothetical protein PRIPAC_85649 [Pristionchus pacificus]|uniref:Uncharacterized protein n=1 Tax=Pristionchus pacificus TaxID=54126 RepID=A0A2A6BSM4_PRIPA|nr:hypothetical protein PRIPAC_85649 [Pristionchus pacificus]|eukprot:PDM68890.1 hypothetical protein PRIPAC_47192 [Pristionchus pacificus]